MNKIQFSLIGAVMVLSLPVIGLANETILPGLYKTTVTSKVKMGGMEMNAPTAEQEDCITEEDVASGPPIPESGDDMDCEVHEYEYGSGRLSLEMTCRMQGGEGRMVGTGSYTKDTYQMTNQFKMKAQGMDMEVNSEVKGVRLGDC